jgi:hypothetical protein
LVERSILLVEEAIMWELLLVGVALLAVGLTLVLAWEDH